MLARAAMRGHSAPGYVNTIIKCGRRGVVRAEIGFYLLGPLRVRCRNELKHPIDLSLHHSEILEKFGAPGGI